MNGPDPEPSGTGTGPIEPVLLSCGEEGFTGTLRADGDPGGTVLFRNGLVVAASSPATPGPESLLLRSGRVGEEDWSRAYTAGAPRGDLAGELVKIDGLGVAGLESVCLSAVFDAVFAIAWCGPGDIALELPGPDDLPPQLPADPGVDPRRLVRETARRLESTAAWAPLGLTMRSRPVAVAPGSVPAISPAALRRAILEHANGRRTARDIAFTIGRGLFAVLTETALMIEDGLLSLGRTPPAPSSTGITEPLDLPLRRPGTSKVVDVLPVTGTTPPPRRRLLAPRSIRPPSAGEEL
ncbi:hypothetical protein [Sphaerisporangium rubeum]|nr:hypothetical protein [Sphaerisporangium rubeum]